MIDVYAKHETSDEIIQNLKSQLKIAEEVITFYASKENWNKSNKTHFCRIISYDSEVFCEPYKRLGYNYDVVEIGGKKAREYLKNKSQANDKLLTPKVVDRVLYYNDLGLNNTEIARLLECSRENVRQVLSKLGIYSPNSWLVNREKEVERT